MVRRIAALCVIAIAGFASGHVWVELYKNEPWYRERPEKSAEWRGVLRRATPPGAPGGRASARFALVTARGTIPVYAPGSLERFEGLLSKTVIVRGKLADLTREGFGRELWPAEAAVLSGH